MSARHRSLDDLAGEIGLPSGRAITGSKTAYGRRHPTHLALYNATITDEGGEHLWSGDLDVTLDEPKLIALAEALGQVLRVMSESEVVKEIGGRHNPNNAVVTVAPGGDVDFSADPRWHLRRDRNGRIIRDLNV